ncbi:MAG: TIGR00180 family glycosyltransferase [Elusimicrobiota bacterium]
MDIDKSLTVLLALKDRVPFTFRWMAYADKICFPFKVLIADGGADETVPEVLSNRNNFPNVDYEYVRYPYDQTYFEYYTKLTNALSRIETPFVAMADNDDFYIVEGLRRSVDFLHAHPDYSSCRGEMGGLFLKRSQKYGNLSEVYGDDFEFGLSSSLPNNLEEETANRRIQCHLLNYVPTFYAVHRTEQLRKCFQTLTEINPSDIFINELITSCLSVAAGKVKIERYLYLVRQQKSPGSSAVTEEQKKGDYFDRMLLASWSNDFSNFLQAVSAVIADNDKISIDNAIRLVREGYRNFVTPQIIRNLSSQAPWLTEWMIRNGQRLNYRFKDDNVLRKILRKFYSIICRIKFKEGRVNVMGKSYRFYKDIKPISEFLAALPSYDFLKESKHKNKVL